MAKKTVLVTGASRGIGKAIAVKFASKGYNVAISCLHNRELLMQSKRDIEAFQASCLAFLGDMGDWNTCQFMFEGIKKEFGSVDVLVNNAGISYIGLLQDMKPEDWDRIVRTNLTSVFNCCKLALPDMISAKRGKIINISSVNGERPFCGATYTSTKGALNTLTKNVAMRLIDTNIRCNAVAPGATVTPAHIANKAGEQPGGAKMLEHSGHFVYFPGPECDPMDQAYACLFLASKMGRHVKGQVIQVCNGAFL